MTYEYNENIRDTMSSLVPLEKKPQIIKEKWDDIISELQEALENKNEFRKRLAGFNALSDIIDKEEWSKVNSIFKTLFMQSFKLIDDPSDNVNLGHFHYLKL